MTKSYANQIVTDAAGNSLAGRNFTVWSAETSGTQYTSGVLNWDGSPASSGVIVSDATGQLWFKGPDSLPDVTWAEAPDSKRYPCWALEAIGAGSGSVDTGATNHWTATQTFDSIALSDGAIAEAKVSGLVADLASRVNPVFKGDVASESAMTALSAGVGDTCRRTDVGALYMLTAAPASTAANWVGIVDAGARARANHTGTQDYLSTTSGYRVTFSTDGTTVPPGADANTAIIYFTASTPTAIPPGPAFQVGP